MILGASFLHPLGLTGDASPYRFGTWNLPLEWDVISIYVLICIHINNYLLLYIYIIHISIYTYRNTCVICISVSVRRLAPRWKIHPFSLARLNFSLLFLMHFDFEDGTSQKSTGLEKFDIFTRLRKRVETILGQIQAKNNPSNFPPKKTWATRALWISPPRAVSSSTAFTKLGVRRT